MILYFSIIDPFMAIGFGALLDTLPTQVAADHPTRHYNEEYRDSETGFCEKIARKSKLHIY